MIDVRTCEVLGNGNGRTTYVHPNDSSLIFKVEHAPVRGRKRWYERAPRIRPSNDREIEGYSAMILRMGRHEDWMTRVLGWMATSEGPALLAENAFFGLDKATPINRLFNGKATVTASRDDLIWARQEYESISQLYCERGIFNHGLKPESVLLGWNDGRRVLRLIDFKSILYRQLISPRLLPRGEHNVQMLTIRSVLGKFDRAISALS